MFVELHELDRGGVNGNNNSARYAVDGGIKTDKINSQKHPVSERQHLETARRGGRNCFVGGPHILKDNITDIEAPINLEGV